MLLITLDSAALFIPGVSNPELSLAQWLPHPTENRIIFVYENDVYVKYQPFDLDAQRITFNGEFGTIFNGIADWVWQRH